MEKLLMRFLCFLTMVKNWLFHPIEIMEEAVIPTYLLQNGKIKIAVALSIFIKDFRKEFLRRQVCCIAIFLNPKQLSLQL